MNHCPIPERLGNTSYSDADENFYKRVELQVSDKFIISLKQDRSESCKISGSPYSVGRLIQAQGLDAYFGTAYHKKRMRADNDGRSSRKRARET